jgi:hypothetical protein
MDFNSQIQVELGNLTPDDQRRVLEYVRSLKRRAAGTPGSVITGFVGSIAADDLEAMRAAIEIGCEQVDLNEW